MLLLTKVLTMSKRAKLIFVSATTVLGGLAFYDSYKCYKRLRKPLNSNCLFPKREFIYITHDYFREPIKDFLNKFFEEETLIYSMLYNLKKKLTFTKVGQ